MLGARAPWPCALPLMVAIALGAGHAHADDATPSVLARLAPRASARHEASTAARAEQLRRLLEAMPGVTRAEVHLGITDASRAPLDAPLAPPRATVVLQARLDAPGDVAIARVAQGVVPELTAAMLTISRHVIAPAPAPAPERVGPLEVTPGVVRWLRMALALSLGCNALLAGLLLWRTRRNRPRDRKVDPAVPGRRAP